MKVKKTIKSLMLAILIFSFVIICGRNVEAKTKYTGGLTVEPSLNQVHLKWKVPKKAKNKIDYFVLYKKDITKAAKKTIRKHKGEVKLPSMSNYHKIKSFSKDSFEYINRNLKREHYYSYVVKGYKQKKGKDKLVYQSKINNALTGIVPIDIYEMEDEDQGITQSKALFEYYDMLNNVTGIEADKIELLCKVKGKKYKKADSLNKKQMNDEYAQYFLANEKLKVGKVYYFKIKAYAKVGNKDIIKKSPSSRYKIVNDDAAIKVESITKPGITDNAILRITSTSKYNGIICFSDDILNYDGLEYSAISKDGKIEVESDYKVSMYSYDNVKWNKFTKKVVKLKPKKSIYIKVVFIENLEENSTKTHFINYLGSDAKESKFEFDEISSELYRGNTNYADYSYMLFDLVNQKNSLYLDSEGV